MLCQSKVTNSVLHILRKLNLRCTHVLKQIEVGICCVFWHIYDLRIIVRFEVNLT